MRWTGFHPRCERHGFQQVSIFEFDEVCGDAVRDRSELGFYDKGLGATEMTTDLIAEARKLIRTRMRQIRRVTPPVQLEKDRVVATDIRSDFLDGNVVRRLVIHLHSTGCEWARRTGGCTMCGFYAGTSVGTPISADNYLTQLTSELAKYDLTKFPVLAVFNAGNTLSETEIPFDALEGMCRIVAKKPHIQRIQIESKLEYIDADKLRTIKRILHDKEIELGMGVETTSEKIRDLCINKPFPNTLLEDKIELLRSCNISPKAYILLKPPFLTEREALEDSVNSVVQLYQLGVERVDCETMTVERHTLVHELWKQGLYRPPWLWSIIELKSRLAKAGTRPVYFTPFKYIVHAIDKPHNCQMCDEKTERAIFDCQDKKITLQALTGATCQCKTDWQNELTAVDYRTIEERIIEILK